MQNCFFVLPTRIMAGCHRCRVCLQPGVWRKGNGSDPHCCSALCPLSIVLTARVKHPRDGGLGREKKRGFVCHCTSARSRTGHQAASLLPKAPTQKRSDWKAPQRPAAGLSHAGEQNNGTPMPGFRFSPPSPQLGSKLSALPAHRMEAALPPRSAAQRNGGRAPRGGSAARPQPPASSPPPPLRPPHHGAGKGDRKALERQRYAPRARARRSRPPKQRYESLRCWEKGEVGNWGGSLPPSCRAAPLPPRGGYHLHFVSPPARRPRPTNMVPEERGVKVTWRESGPAAARAAPAALSSRRPSPTREAASPRPRAVRALSRPSWGRREGSADRPKKEGGRGKKGR